MFSRAMACASSKVCSMRARCSVIEFDSLRGGRSLTSTVVEALDHKEERRSSHQLYHEG